jgi:hypothetical protein
MCCIHICEERKILHMVKGKSQKKEDAKVYLQYKTKLRWSVSRLKFYCIHDTIFSNKLLSCFFNYHFDFQLEFDIRNETNLDRNQD